MKVYIMFYKIYKNKAPYKGTLNGKKVHSKSIHDFGFQIYSSLYGFGEIINDIIRPNVLFFMREFYVLYI